MFLGLGECRRFVGGFGVLQFASMQKFIFWVAVMLSQKIWCTKSYTFRRRTLLKNVLIIFYSVCVCVCVCVVDCKVTSFFSLQDVLHCNG
jgi:hypothetical protein